MNILITGAAGFIGSNLVASLSNSAEKVHIYAVDNFFSTKRQHFDDTLCLPEKKNRCELFKIDFYDLETMIPLLEVIDVVVHLAEEKDKRVFPERAEITQSQVERWKKNVEGYRRLLEASIICGVKRVILGSWSGVYMKLQNTKLSENEPMVPINQYFQQKIAQEYYNKMFAHEYMLDTVTLRMSNVYGVGHATHRWYVDNEPGVISVMVGDALRKKMIEVHNKGEQKRNFIFVGDVVEALMKSIYYKNKFAGNTFNICSDEDTRIIDIAHWIAHMCDAQIQHKDMKWQKSIIQHPISNVRARKTLGFCPTSDIHKKLQDMIETARTTKDML